MYSMHCAFAVQYSHAAIILTGAPSQWVAHALPHQLVGPTVVLIAKLASFVCLFVSMSHHQNCNKF